MGGTVNKLVRVERDVQHPGVEQKASQLTLQLIQNHFKVGCNCASRRQGRVFTLMSLSVCCLDSCSDGSHNL